MIRKSVAGAVVALALAGQVTANDELAELERATDDAIHSACHGYLIDMIPDLLSSAREWLNENSPLCRDLRAQGDDYDVGTTLERHQVAFTAEDSRRIDAAFQAWKNADLDLQIECDSEYMCMRIRKDLQQRNIPIDQARYQQVADYCESQPSPYGCLQDWFRDEWIAKGTRQPPKAPASQSAGLSFDDLMREAPSTKQSDGGGKLGFEQLMGADSNRDDPSDSLAALGSSDEQSGEIGFGDIYAGRSEHRIAQSQASLADKDGHIAAQCSCSQSGSSCFTKSEFDHDQLNQAMDQADAVHEGQRAEVCQAWAENLRGHSADDDASLARLHENLDIVLANLDRLSGNYREVVAGLQQKQDEIDAAVRRQQQQQQQAADDEMFGKMLAIGIAGIAAAGSDLPTDQAVEVFSQVSQNILNDTSGFDMAAASQQLDLQPLQLPGGSPAYSGGSSGSLSLTCKVAGACAEYTFSSSQDRDNFARQCAQVVQGSCPAGPSCTQTAGGRKVTTYSYNQSAAHVKLACQQGQGIFNQ